MEVQAVHEFIFDKTEMTQTLSDDDFVERLYYIYFNRPSDADGKREWLEQLKIDGSRARIAEGFAQSDEFKRRCADSGIPY